MRAPHKYLVRPFLLFVRTIVPKFSYVIGGSKWCCSFASTDVTEFCNKFIRLCSETKLDFFSKYLVNFTSSLQFRSSEDWNTFTWREFIRNGRFKHNIVWCKRKNYSIIHIPYSPPFVEQMWWKKNYIIIFIDFHSFYWHFTASVCVGFILFGLELSASYSGK